MGIEGNFVVMYFGNDFSGGILGISWWGVGDIYVSYICILVELDLSNKRLLEIMQMGWKVLIILVESMFHILKMGLIIDFALFGIVSFAISSTKSIDVWQ